MVYPTLQILAGCKFCESLESWLFVLLFSGMHAKSDIYIQQRVKVPKVVQQSNKPESICDGRTQVRIRVSLLKKQLTATKLRITRSVPIFF